MTEPMKQSGQTLDFGVAHGVWAVAEHVKGFFNSIDWAIRFSHRCQMELQAGTHIDSATLNRIVQQTNLDRPLV